MLILFIGLCSILFVFETAKNKTVGKPKTIKVEGLKKKKKPKESKSSLEEINKNEAANSLSYCGEPKTWIEAKIFCEMKGGRLMNRDTENDATFLSRSDIPAYQEVWLGQYKGLSGWVEEIGCYDERSLGVSWYSIQQPNNAASICQTICNATDYFAMKGSTCLCSYNNFVNISYFTPKSNCVLKCPGNATENCGGSGSMTVYHRVRGELIRYDPDSYPHLQCAMMNCSSSSDWTYHEHDCSDNLTALCGSGVLVNQPATWQTAQSFCKNYGSLIGLHNMVPSCAISNNDVKRQFWIGLFRNQVKLDLKDRLVQNPVIGCYAIVKQPSTETPISQFYSIDVCEKHNRFPFICEMPPGNPTDNGCILPSTTTATPTTVSDAQPIVEPDDEGLKIGLYVALGVVILAAIIVVLLLFTRRKKSNPEIPRRLYLLQALSNIKRRRNREDNSPRSSTPINTEKGTVNDGFTEGQFEDRKPQYAVVNKPGRRQSAPEPSYKVYNKPVTVLDNSHVGVSMPNNGYDTLHTDSMTEHTIPTNSILKPNDKITNDRYLPRHVRIQEEGYSRHNGQDRANGHNLSIPRKVIPVPPPVVKYPPEHNSSSYDHIGTTLL